MDKRKTFRKSEKHNENYIQIVYSNCNCVYCNNRGVCKNEDNRYSYDQPCPGDCDYYYRK